MPSSLIYLSVMLVVILAWFVWMKRPIYEAILLSFLILVTITGTWAKLPDYFEQAISTSLLYSMTAFVCMSILMTKTKIIDGCIGIILALIGRIPGGAGYTAVIASAFMGSLSGSGPGNVMATGTITIPAMKRSGFPAELAANVESNASCMGNMIPPSSNILAAMGAFSAVYPHIELTTGQFWVVLWGISLWFVLQRMIMVFAFCKYYKVKPMSKDELPSIKETLRENWTGLFLPVIILLPFVLDYMFKDTFFTERLGAAGAKSLSSSLLMFIGGIASIYTCLVAKDKKLVTPNAIAKTFSNAVKSIVPVVVVCLFGYMMGALFAEINVSEELGEIIASWNFGKFGTIIAICIITCVIGMVITGSSMTVIFGSTFITTLVAAGCDPILSAAMLPCICGVMSLITPPLGLCMYAGMTIADSDFEKTFKNNLWWVAAHFILEVVVLMGWLPIIGI